VTRVETESGFRAALQQGGFDVILADYALPSFDGLSALKITLGQRPDLPFIFVSGTMGEEVAIEALKIGATDYVLKTRLSRLVPSVQRALREARERAELRRAEQALRTERKLAEAERERLRQLQVDLAHMSRVITVGQLGASLAHEIKQPIGAAVTNAEACVRLLDRDEPDLPEAREAALEMVRDARRAAGIIDRVRSLYQKGSSEPAMVDVNEVIGEMVVMLRSEANRHSVSMRADLAEGLPTVMADRVQLQQALMNLMLNGIEAMNDTSGELSVRSMTTEDGQLVVSVSDCGIGLPVKQVERIFDAFFTTKPHGTGMGLSISRTIIESCGGHLWATPNAERGATFHFTLPTKVKASSPSAA
jgi:signal transduction histidine kinase